MKVVVLSGGFSEEQHASRKSGRYVAQALKELGHNVVTLEYDINLMENIKHIFPDTVFHIVQGKYHGDGTVQALLELLGIPYVGSRPYSAAIINHKTRCKELWRAAGIPTPDFFEYDEEEYKKDSFNNFRERVNRRGLTLPIVLKPPTQGSRYGMVFVNDENSFQRLADSFRYDKVLLSESYVKGRYITQGIIEIDGKMTTLPPIEVMEISDAQFKVFSSANKNTVSETARLTPIEMAEINRISLSAAAQVGASGFARLDYHISEGKLFLLEINGVPGLIPDYSCICKCCDAAGYDYNTFISMLLATARGR